MFRNIVVYLLTFCEVCLFALAICARDVCRNERLRLTIPNVKHFGFDDYSTPSIMNGSEYMSSLLDSAPCPPPWSTELLCKSKTQLSCKNTVYLLGKCLDRLKHALDDSEHYLCNVLDMCGSELNCSEFLSQFAQNITFCRQLHSGSTHNHPTTPPPRITHGIWETTASSSISLTTTSATRPSTQFDTVVKPNSSYLQTLPQSVSNEATTTNQDTPPLPGSRKPAKDKEQDGGHVAGIVIGILLSLLILISIIIFAIVYFRRQTNYKVTLRQWSTTSTAPLTKTADGYQLCCIQMNQRKSTNPETQYGIVAVNDTYNSENIENERKSSYIEINGDTVEYKQENGGVTTVLLSHPSEDDDGENDVSEKDDQLTSDARDDDILDEKHGIEFSNWSYADDDYLKESKSNICIYSNPMENIDDVIHKLGEAQT